VTQFLRRVFFDVVSDISCYDDAAMNADIGINHPYFTIELGDNLFLTFFPHHSIIK
jgi:hypothetical protein